MARLKAFLGFTVNSMSAKEGEGLLKKFREAGIMGFGVEITNLSCGRAVEVRFSVNSLTVAVSPRDHAKKIAEVCESAGLSVVLE